MKIFFQGLFHYLPMPIMEYLQDTLPLKAFEKARINREVAHRVAHQLIAAKSADLLADKTNRDVMSILGKCPQSNV